MPVPTEPKDKYALDFEPDFSLGGDEASQPKPNPDGPSGQEDVLRISASGEIVQDKEISYRKERDGCGKRIGLGCIALLGVSSAGVVALNVDLIRGVLQSLSEEDSGESSDEAPKMDDKAAPKPKVRVALRNPEWSERTEPLTDKFTTAIGEEIKGKGAKASLTVECKDGTFSGTLYKHALPEQALPTVTDWGISQSGEPNVTINTNYGPVKHPWLVCEKTTGGSQLTTYLK